MTLLKRTEHAFKAAFLASIKMLLRRKRSFPSPLNATKMNRVLFLRPEKIGDMVISLPVFEALKTAFPHLAISVLASPRSLSLVNDDPRFEKIFVYDKSVVGSLRLLGQLKRERFDCILDMIDNDSATTLICSQYIAGGAPTISIGKEQFAEFYDFNHPHSDGVGGHIIDNPLNLLVPLGVEVKNANRYAPPFVPSEVQKRAKDFLSQCKEPDANGIIAVNLSAGRPNRMWPVTNFVELVNQLLEAHPDYAIILIVVPNDRKRAEEVCARVKKAVAVVPDKQSLTEVSAIISGCDLLISPDTSLIHIARSFQVPVVGLYNDARKNFKRWQPYDQPDGTVIAKDKDSLNDIEPSRVASQVSVVLARLGKAVV